MHWQNRAHSPLPVRRFSPVGGCRCASAVFCQLPAAGCRLFFSPLPAACCPFPPPSMHFGSMFSVSGSTSTRIGRAPTCSITWTLEQNVNGVVMTASPGPTPTSRGRRAAPQSPN